ncbi:MAG: hypothetical protein EOO68_36285 [Moraxellaceae bacterium]|nr:MAG: hypothetical protein EOO68_36285 [Moraxellaceae bacterium]
MRNLLIILLALRSIIAFASGPKPSPCPDNIFYECVREMLLLHKNDTVLVRKYRENWLLKARQEKNYREEVAALRDIMYHANKKYLAQYADSLVIAAQNTKDAVLIGQAWLTKGIAYYGQNKNQQALKYYLKADSTLAPTTETYSKYKVRYAIANTKYYLGFYDEAKSLFLQCLDYNKNENDTAYLSTLYSLALCEGKLGHFDKSYMYATIGRLESQNRPERRHRLSI